MARIDRIETELTKAHEKMQELQLRIDELEQQHADEEDAMILQMVRKQKMTHKELAQFLDRNKGSLTNPTKLPPVSPGQHTGPREPVQE